MHVIILNINSRKFDLITSVCCTICICYVVKAAAEHEKWGETVIGAGLIAGIVIVGAMMIFGKGSEKLKYGCLFFILILIVLAIVAVSLLQGL